MVEKSGEQKENLALSVISFNLSCYLETKEICGAVNNKDVRKIHCALCFHSSQKASSVMLNSSFAFAIFLISSNKS